MSTSSFTTAATSKSGGSNKTRLSASMKSVDEEQLGEYPGEENQEEESSTTCVKEKVIELKDPTPKQILGMFEWNGENLYDHLTKLIDELISTRPDNVMEYFDQYSHNLRFKKPPFDPLLLLPNAVKLGKMYGLIYPTFDEETTAKPKITYPWDYVYYFEEMGICLPREELYQITLALRKLALVEGLTKIRFWGKIFGIERSYIVAECEMTHEEIQHRRSMEKEEIEDEEEAEEEEEESIYSNLDEPLGLSGIFKKKKKPVDELGEEVEEEDEMIPLVYKKLDKYVKPPVPKPPKLKPKKMVPEKTGEGVNKNAYYVCHEAGDEWNLLPNAKPEDIIIARKIRKHFKGYLLSKVESYPPYTGMEKELLRAQIARITAGTQISPLGYYQFGGGEEGEYLAEDAGEGEIVANLDYEAIPPQDLLKTEFWVHHARHILRIGRTSYHKEPRPMNEEEIEDEIRETVDKNNLEVGPPLLTPLSEDVSMEMIQPWVIKSSSALLPATGVIAVRSNLWPGAYAFAKGRIFENIYIGWGIKLCVEGFNPHYLPKPQVEYEVGPEIMEITDPTPEMEDEWREANKPRPVVPMKGEEGGWHEDEEDESGTN